MRQGTRIGRLLVEMGKVAPEALDGAATMAPDRPLRFASRLRALYGSKEADLLAGLAIQKGLPGVVLSESRLDLSALGAIPKEVAVEGQFLPLSLEEGLLHVAFVNPDDRALIDEIKFVTGADVLPYVALQGVLDEAVKGAFDAAAEGAKFWSFSGKEGDQASIERVQPPADLQQHRSEHPAGEHEEEEEILSIAIEMDEEPPGGLGDQTPSEASAEPAGEGARLLVVDDEPEIVHLLGTAFSKAGYRVQTAARGLEALEKVRAFEPQIVVLDAMLPEVHGFEICRKIRTSRRFGHVPVVMISAVYRGWRFAQDVKEVYGASDFIEKPFRIADVLTRVGAALEGATEQPEASEESRDRAVRAYRRGVGMLKVGKVDGALAAFQEGIRSDAFSAALHFSLGRALQIKKEYYAAIASYERAIELKPTFFPALKSLALLYESKGFLRKAIETWERALPNAPDDSNRRMARERLLRLIEVGRSALQGSDELA